MPKFRGRKFSRRSKIFGLSTATLIIIGGLAYMFTPLKGVINNLFKKK